jgi:8-oxo-dGTP pyrophosphatase MutT (NUDIX family)
MLAQDIVAPNTEPTKPRPAATVLLLREAGDGFEVFMVVRHHQIDFASGALVFPGGSVDAGDKAIAAELGAAEDEHLAFRVAAIRETFEETGILLARPTGSPDFVSAQRAREVEDRHRDALNNRKITFAEILAAESLVPAPDLLTPFAHWITPAVLPKRFDTQFFVVAAPPDQLGAHDGHESVESIWINPQRAIDDAKSGRFKVIFATERNLFKLARHRTAAEAIAAARQSRIVSVLPELLTTETGRQLRIPLEADYGGDVFDFT